MAVAIPGFVAFRSNPGLELANAFGVQNEPVLETRIRFSKRTSMV